MSEKIETIVIQTKNGPVTINKSDLKPEHEIFIEAAAIEAAAIKAAAGPVVNQSKKSKNAK
jgi:hypothetical protein